MSLFLIAILLITVNCIALIVFTMLKRHKTDQQNQSTSIMSKPKSTALLVSISILVVGLLTYLTVGSPTAIQNESSSNQASDNAEQPNLNEMIEKLNNHLVNNADDIKGWKILSTLSIANQDDEGALKAIQKAYDLAMNAEEGFINDKDKAAIMTQYVDTHVALNQTFSKELQQILQDSLQLDKDNVQTYWLLGSSHAEKKSPELAIGYFEQAKAKLESLLLNAPTNSEQAVATQNDIAVLNTFIYEQKQILDPNFVIPQEAKAQQDTAKNVAENTPKVDISEMIKDMHEIPVSIKLSNHVVNVSDPEDTIFIIVRSNSGPQAPFIVIKRKVQDFPMDITLDNSNRMLPFVRIDDYIRKKILTIVVRRSKTGQTLKQPDDIETSVVFHEWLEQGNPLPVQITL